MDTAFHPVGRYPRYPKNIVLTFTQVASNPKHDRIQNRYPR